MVNLLPHLVKFVESKSSVIMQAAEPEVGDVAVLSLLLQILESVFSNRFFDMDFSLKTVIPVLMNLTLCHKFHQ